MSIYFRLFLVLFFSILSASGAQASKIYRTIHYYNISGKTARDLDKALRAKGPYVKSTGANHPGATTITFLPDVRLKQIGKYCHVTRANFNIRAQMQLPKWRQRATTHDPILAVLWDTLSRDIKNHEESHAVIARSYATKMELAIRKVPVRRDCVKMGLDVAQVVAKILKEHDDEQAHFDLVEGLNFNNRLSRLMKYQVEKILNEQ